MARGGNTFPLTPGQATTVNPPAAGQQYGAVVFQNISPYLCVVSVGVDQYFLAPYMADLFPLVNADGSFSTSQPPTVVPANLDNVSGVSANLTATFYEPGEAPSGGYPVSLASPAAIASETAAALLTTGVPNVLNETQLAALTLHTADPLEPVQPLPIGGYASLALDFSSNAPGGGAPASTVQVIQYHANGDQAYNDVLAFGATLAGPAVHAFVLPVLGATAQFQLLTGYNPTTLTILGSNRNAPRGYSPLALPNKQFNGGLNRIQSVGALGAPIAMTAGTAYALSVGSLPAGQQLQADFAILNSTTVKGFFYVLDDLGASQFLADTNEAAFHTLGSDQHCYKNIILPFNSNGGLRFFCLASGTASPQIQATAIL